MNSKLLPWLSAVVSVAMVCMAFLLWRHIDPAPFLALLGITLTPLVGATLYAKVDKVEQQTNGTQQSLVTMVNGVLEHLKTHNSVPVPKEAVKLLSTVEGVDLSSTVDIQKVVSNGGTEPHQ